MKPGEDGESLNDRHYWVLSQLAQDVKLTKHHVMAHYAFSERSAIDTAGLTGIDALRHLLAKNDMNASDLGRLLSVHPSRGSKILKGERSLTVDHLLLLDSHEVDRNKLPCHLRQNRTIKSNQQAGSTGPDPTTLAKLDELRMRRGQTQKSIRAALNVVDQDEGFLADELKRLNGELRSLDKSIRDLETKATRGAPVELDRVGEALRAIAPSGTCTSKTPTVPTGR